MSRSKHPTDTPSPSGGRHPTRQAVLIDHLQRMLNETGRSLADFSEHLAQAYEELVPEAHRALGLCAQPAEEGCEAYFRWKQALEKAVHRFVDGSVRIPVELEEAWLAALPGPYRGRCRHDLCVRMGVLPVEIPAEETSAQDIGDLLEAAGAEATAAAPVFADGRMSEADAEHLPALIQANEISAAHSLTLAAKARKILRRIGKGDGSRLEAVKS